MSFLLTIRMGLKTLIKLPQSGVTFESKVKACKQDEQQAV